MGPAGGSKSLNAGSPARPPGHRRRRAAWPPSDPIGPRGRPAGLVDRRSILRYGSSGPAGSRFAGAEDRQPIVLRCLPGADWLLLAVPAVRQGGAKLPDVGRSLVVRDGRSPGGGEQLMADGAMCRQRGGELARKAMQFERLDWNYWPRRPRPPPTRAYPSSSPPRPLIAICFLLHPVCGRSGSATSRQDTAGRSEKERSRGDDRRHLWHGYQRPARLGRSDAEGRRRDQHQNPGYPQFDCPRNHGG